MHREGDDIRLSECERTVIADLEAAFSRDQTHPSPEPHGPRPKVREWIGPAALVALGTMLMALSTLGSLWLVVFGASLLVGGIALLATR